MTLDELVQRFQGRRVGSYAMLRCPSHKDHQASLSASESNGRLLLKCHAGCDTKAILNAWGLAWSDVLPEREDRPQEITWQIKDASGAVVAEHVRVPLAGGGKRFIWRRNGSNGLGGMRVADLPLYGAEIIGQAKT